MIHIRQINSSFNINETYTVVNTDNWDSSLGSHPSIVEHPESFEIVDCEIPEHAQYLIYVSDESQ